MTKIFISYSRKDKAQAQKLTEALTQSDLETWVDWQDIPPTADWMEQIHKGIEQADAFLFLLSPDSIQSEVCAREVDHAALNGKRLIPIVARDVNPKEVHPALAKVNWIYIREQDDFESAINKTLSAIRTDLAWVETHKRLQVRAIEWNKRKDGSLLLRGKDLREAEETLASVGQKDPQPTDLQRLYLLASRRAEIRTRNLLLVIGAVVMVILAMLSAFALNQRNTATANASTAIANQNLAQTAQANAERQARVALARQLAAQAQNLSLDNGTSNIQSGLLAVESVRLEPGAETAQAVRRYLALAGLPRLSIQQPNSVASLAFSPDGRLLLSQEPDGKLHLWETSSGQEIGQVTNNSYWYMPGFSADDRFVVGQISGGGFCWWQITQSTTDCVTSAASTSWEPMSADKGLIVSNDPDGTIRVWQTSPGKELARFPHSGPVQSVNLSPDGRKLVTNSCSSKDSSGNCASGTLLVWEVQTQKTVAQINYTSPLSVISLSPDGKRVLGSGCLTYIEALPFGCRQASLHVWEASTSREIALIDYTDASPNFIISPDGFYVAIGHILNLRIFSLETFQETAYASREGGQLVPLKFSPDGLQLAWRYTLGSSFNQSEALHLLNVYGSEDGVLAHAGIVMDSAFSLNSAFFVSGSLDGTTRLWGNNRREELARLAFDSGVNAVAFAPSSDTEGPLLAAGNVDGTIRLWEPILGDRLAQPSAYAFTPQASASPDGRYLVSIDAEGRTHVQAKDSGSEIVAGLAPAVPAQVNYIPLAFSPDSRTLAFGNGDRVQVRALANGQDLAGWLQPFLVLSLAFSPDGNQVVALDLKNNISVREVQTGLEWLRARLPISFSPDNQIAFSQDGRYLITKSGYNESQAWVWRNDDLIAEACLRVTRNLTRAEWQQYIGDALPYQAVCPNLPIESEPTATPTP